MHHIKKTEMGLKTKSVRNLVVLIILLTATKLSFSQTKLEKVTLSEYEITDTNLIRKIDDFLLAETVCNYYSDYLKLSIDICDWNGNLHDKCIDSDTLSVTISSIGWEDLFFLNAVGYFSYKGHLFSISNVATIKFFKPTGKRKKFTYEYPQYLRIDDDSMTSWNFKYYDDHFILQHEKYNCPTKRN